MVCPSFYLPAVIGSSACPLIEWFQQAQDSLVAYEAGAGNSNYLHWSARYLACTLMYALSATSEFFLKLEGRSDMMVKC